MIDNMIEIELDEPDAFLKIKETLTRIGIASKKTQTLWQSCHILHKRGFYYIVHFKELFALDGKPTEFTEEDINRRNYIANLLQSWGLLKLKSEAPVNPDIKVGVKIVQYNEKFNWELVTKYSIGAKK
jgi:hypothetical protein